MRLRTGLGIAAVALAATAAAVVVGIGLGHFAGPSDAGRPAPPVADEGDLAARAASGARAAGALDAPGAKQILFGDLHVHTTFSSDAFLFSLPVLQGEGARPPADACDFARFCSQLDFWSINDHAELLTPEQWRLTKDAIRECNAVAGDPANPDLVAFLGWEWTNAGATAAEHYGHKNVVLRGIADGEVPTRPIGAGPGSMSKATGDLPLLLRAAMPFIDGGANLGWYLQFNRFLRIAAGTPACAAGVDVRELPDDCFEAAPTPDVLFEKLDQWGFDALVIPHGTSWGLMVPPGAAFSAQLGQHDPQRQRLIEVFSGHGNSEVHRAWRALTPSNECPAPSSGYVPCCWQAGEIVRQRCGDVDAATCEDRVGAARAAFVAAGVDPLRFHLVPGATAEDWGECGQLTDDFLPAYEYRPGMSVQAALAAGDASGARFRFGLIGSSDTHSARAGTGYKEYAREVMTDAWGPREDVLDLLTEPLAAEPEALSLERLQERVSPLQSLLPERGASFYYTGGLVAVHSAGRDRDAIFSALERREVYGTSGPRLLLWFDLITADGSERPMGSEVAMAGTPRFRVRAAGALEQRPGCPETSQRGLTPERLDELCRGECHHPGDTRHAIERIEVVRIRPQNDAGGALADRIDDPWRTFVCGGAEAGCVVEFEDPEFPALGSDAVYYVRALQEATPTVNGDPLRCDRDDDGDCVRPRPCYASGARDANDDCLAPVAHRAWSSPIFLSPSAPAGEG